MVLLELPVQKGEKGAEHSNDLFDDVRVVKPVI